MSNNISDYNRRPDHINFEISKKDDGVYLQANGCELKTIKHWGFLTWLFGKAIRISTQEGTQYVSLETVKQFLIKDARTVPAELIRSIDNYGLFSKNACKPSYIILNALNYYSKDSISSNPKITSDQSEGYPLRSIVHPNKSKSPSYQPTVSPHPQHTVTPSPHVEDVNEQKKAPSKKIEPNPHKEDAALKHQNTQRNSHSGSGLAPHTANTTQTPTTTADLDDNPSGRLNYFLMNLEKLTLENSKEKIEIDKATALKLLEQEDIVGLLEHLVDKNLSKGKLKTVDKDDLFFEIISEYNSKLDMRSKEKKQPTSKKIEPNPSKEEVNQAQALSDQEFLNWIKQDTKRLNNENSERLISIIKKDEVSEEELREFYAQLDEQFVLNLLLLTQTQKSFNAIDKKTIEKALITETNFIQAINSKCPHKDPTLRKKIESKTLGPSIFKHSMKDEEIEQIGRSFFEELKDEGLLLTKQQFDESGIKEACIRKSFDIGRILGSHYITKTAEELGLKHIKVPKKYAVISHDRENKSSLEAFVDKRTLEIKTHEVEIYAEKITPLERKATREELKELLQILEATGYGDFMGDNFFVGRNQNGEEGIYFIDTEYNNFRHAPFLDMCFAGAVTRVTDTKDYNWINQEDLIPLYHRNNGCRVSRYCQLYNLAELTPEQLFKTYEPDAKRSEHISFSYNLDSTHE